MKTRIGKLNWLAALFVAGAMGFGRANAQPQDAEPSAMPSETATTTTNGESATTEASAEATNSAPNRWEVRSNFKQSLDQHGNARHHEALVVFGKDVELKSNETAEAVVVIGGSAKVRGQVRDAVVVIGGDAKLEGAEVGDAVVAVLGGVNIGQGSTVHGDVVSVGDSVEVSDDSTVNGQIQPVDFGRFGLPKLDWLKQWALECVFKLRPLAIAPHLGWIWAVAGAFFLIYLLVAVALPKPVAACVEEMTRRPATTFFLGLLTKLLLPVVTLVLMATGIGLLVVPFLVAAAFFAVLIGKVALLEYLGGAVGRAFGANAVVKPVIAFCIGCVIVTLLYLVPILGLITLAITSLWGLGLAVTAGFGGLRREAPTRPAASPVQPMAPLATQPAPAAGFAAVSAGTAASPMTAPSSSPQSFATPAGGSAQPITQPVVTEALTYPRAGFWERMGAAFLDVILVAVVGHLAGPFFPLVMLAYFAGMWAWRGTSVGGIVLNLKVVRQDGQPVTFVVALVRGLAAAFSAMVMFLGFFWIAWDKERQGWHDKIAGTVVIRVPRGAPLVCL